MKIAIVLLGVVCVVLCIVCWQAKKKCAEILDMLTDLALHTTEREDWENETFERHDHRIEDAQNLADEATRNCKAASEKAEALCARVDELAKRMDEFNELTAEAVKAQMDADLAWAEGVRSITSYGSAVPRLDVESLIHE